MMIFEVKNARRYARLMQFQVKLQEAEEITYLEGSKKEGRYCVTYLQVLELKKKEG